MHHDVRTPGEAVQVQCTLHREQGHGTTAVVHQEIDEVLAHPFLGGERHPAPAHRIEDLRTVRPVLSFEPVVGQVEVPPVHEPPS